MTLLNHTYTEHTATGMVKLTKEMKAELKLMEELNVEEDAYQNVMEAQTLEKAALDWSL